MAPSRAAVNVFSAPEIRTAIAELRNHALLAEEATWVLDNLDAMDRCLLNSAIPSQPSFQMLLRLVQQCSADTGPYD